jgi:hypothetical protein
VKRSGHRPADVTAAFILRHGSWRTLAAVALLVAPVYAWVQFYYLSTGAWNQSRELVAVHAPLLATFLVPLAVAAWVMGFRGRYLFIGALASAVIAGWMSPDSLAAQLLPYGYINLGIILILLIICWRAFCYWRDRHIHALPIVGYTKGARVVAAVAVLILLVLLLPVKI